MKYTKKLQTISLIIPTYNDEATIIPQVKACEKILKSYCKDYEIIIADDFSADKTRILLHKNFDKKKNYRLVFNEKNLGITSNVRQLYFMAKKEFVFFYSADGDWDTADVENIIKTQIKEKAAIVIGKRRQKIGYTLYRHIVSYLHKLLPQIIIGVDTIDPGGIKLIKRELAQIELSSKSQFFEAEIIIKAILKGYKVSSYPVVYKKIYKGAGYGGGFIPAFHSVIDIFRVKASLYNDK